MKNPEKILVTSALPYANGPLHLGHIAGAYLPADVYVRYQRLKGRDVLYICGSDEHGVPITVRADNEGITPQDVVDRYHAMNKESFEKLNISFDNYSRTSLPLHHETAQEFFTALHAQGKLVTKTEEQFYSEKSKRFLPDRYVEGICPYCHAEGARGDQCDHCGKWLEPGELQQPKSKIDGSTPVLKETSHWYLPMGQFSDAWKTWFDSHTWKANVMNYCMGWYKEGLGDRPITRDLNWGIPVPLDNADGKVLYVWFDAPIGYISSTKEWAQKIGQPDKWKEYWQNPDTKLVHFIGKDNVVFHAILFPMMLMQMDDYVLPSAIPANEYLTIESQKISTSLNYAIWVKDYLESFDPDPLRYTLAANAPESKDTDMSWKQFQSRHNDELADILGNFINRSMTFVHRFYDGKVPPLGSLDAMDQAMLDEIREAPARVGAFFETFELRKATRAFMDICRSANKYFNDKAPWQTRKSDPDVCATTLNICLQISRCLSVLMAPILPDSSKKVQAMLNISPISWDDAAESLLTEGHDLGEAQILFVKIDDEVIERESAKLRELAKPRVETKKDTVPVKEQIDFELFGKIDLRTARVVEAEKIKGADKLLKLQIEVGDETRQIVAGVAQSFTPEEMTGKEIIIVANLKPAKIRGVESNGMLLAVKDENGFVLAAAPGAPSGIPVG